MNYTEQNAEEVNFNDLLCLRKSIIRVFGKFKHRENDLEDPDKINIISELGRLIRIYWEFHRLTDEMSPDRATDFSETSEKIMEFFSTDQKKSFCESFQKDVIFSVEATEKMHKIPCLPFLREMTISQLTQSKHQFDASKFTRQPRRR